MDLEAVPIPFALKIAAVVAITVLIVVVVAVSSCSGGDAAAVHDVERALGPATLMTYAQAAMAGGKAAPEGLSGECCAICLSEYAKGDELVRVVPACGHFFHAECDVDWWLRTRRTCPICRGGLWPLPRPPRPECPPMPPRAPVVASPRRVDQLTPITSCSH